MLYAVRLRAYRKSLIYLIPMPSKSTQRVHSSLQDYQYYSTNEPFSRLLESKDASCSQIRHKHPVMKTVNFNFALVYIVYKLDVSYTSQHVFLKVI